MSKKAISANAAAILSVLAGLVGGVGIGAGVAGIGAARTRRKRQEIPTTAPDADFSLPYPQLKTAAPVWSGDWLKENPSAWAIPATATAGGLGLFAASKLITKLVNKKRKEDLEQELIGSQKNFKDSLLNQYKPENTHQLKEGSADPVNRLFYKLADTASNVTGAGITGLGLLAALAATGAYHQAHGQSKEDLLRKAIQHKAYINSLRSPTAISFHPESTEVNPDTAKAEKIIESL
jgi:hypothetical protein